MAKKMKFAMRPKDAPGPDESKSEFIERMGAHGNVAALDQMQDYLDVGNTYESYRADKNPPQ